MGILQTLGEYIVAPFAAFSLRAKLMASMVWFQESDQDRQNTLHPYDLD